MFGAKKKQKTITYEQAQAIITELAEMRQDMAQTKRSGGAGGLLGAVVNTTDPRLDGHITLADVIVAGMIPVGFGAAGMALAAGAMLAGAPFDDAMELMGRSVQVGGGVGALRLAGDALNLGGLWYGTIGFILEHVEEWREEREEQEEQAQEPPTRLVPYQGPELRREELPAPPTDDRRKEYELDDEIVIPIRQLLQFVTTAYKENDWTRSGWCGGDGKEGRGLSQPLWYLLRDHLEELGVWGTRDRPTLESFIDSLRTP